MPGWSVAYDGIDPEKERIRETLCTVGNGYFATRGSAPEAVADAVHYPGTYAAGCYNALTDTVAGREVVNESMVNLPDWLATRLRFGDGPWFDAGSAPLTSYRQTLDLRRGVLVRDLAFRDADGRSTRIVQRRFAHMEFEHVGALQTTVLAEDWSGTLTVRSVLDGESANAGVERYRELSGRHLRVERAEVLDGDTALVETETVQSRLRIAQAIRTRVARDGDGRAPEFRPVADGSLVGHDLIVPLEAGRPVTVEKTATLFTGHDRAISEPAEAAMDWLGRLDGFDALLVRHTRAWRHLWQRCRVDLGRDEEAAEALRLHVFHLLQTVSPNTVGLDAGVPARGLHGEAYRGHVFWDELFVLPALTTRLPHVARSLLGYRHRRLPAARWAARDIGARGAMYPWQSGADGAETSQSVHLNPDSGRWLPDATHLQRHVGLAVAYNVWQYYQASGDREFLVERGAEMVLEIARFFGSIACYDHARDRFTLRGVVGPDEFHTRYPGAETPGIDDNAYTNVMTAWLLERAGALLKMLPTARHAELSEALGLTAEEIELWGHVAQRLYVPFHDDGVISQFAGYDKLDELDWAGLRARHGDIRRLDRVLEAEGDDVNRYKASKQADVLMLFYLLSADELHGLMRRLGYPWEPSSIPRTIEYYLARTSHGSTLSTVVHASVLARSHRREALRYFLEVLRSDVADVQGGTTAEGVHLAAMAGSLDVLQRCFAGVETRGDALHLDPFWPAELGHLEFTMNYREHALTVRINGDRVLVDAVPGGHAPIRVRCRGESALLAPGGRVAFPGSAEGALAGQ
ncbi:glycoside hydrolase family 65 protein [Actinospica sp. MGRD01-02]|uniref:Glycoside hydrolase family 65 protein n=1 Tax=Actinospica acidithermotolerans TaxID=2828514 RepID=A0A941E5S6_9ACTN|nr:glycoside hydrolase family 65 protein [Actinospica acidithermotolerans]MBR7825616.1 glycoside hydrolase family 65 protein [Actinospica acidithermotolerans]